MEELRETYITPVVPLDFTYNYRVGQYMERFLNSLKDKKLMGVKCPECGKVFVPPRMFCGSCNQKLDEWVEVAQTGMLANFTVGHVVLEKGARLAKAESPYVLGLIKLDDVDSLLLARVEKVAPADLKKGMRMKAVWKEELAGDYSDLDHFEPA